jgi:ribosome-associated translation inhibitor RaiA
LLPTLRTNLGHNQKKIMSQPKASATSTTDDNQIEITVEGEQKFHNVELNDAETKSEEANAAFNKAFYSLNEAISKLHEKRKGDVVPTITTDWDIVHAVVSRELHIQPAASKLFQVTFAHDNTTASFETIELGRAWSGYFCDFSYSFWKHGSCHLFVNLCDLHPFSVLYCNFKKFVNISLITGCSSSEHFLCFVTTQLVCSTTLSF